MKACSPPAWSKALLLLLCAACLGSPQTRKSPTDQKERSAQSGPAGADTSPRADAAADKASLLAELQSLEYQTRQFNDASAEAQAKAEIADAAWQLDPDWSRKLLRTAYKLLLPEREKSSSPNAPAGSIPPSYDAAERARRKIRSRVLEVARRDEELVNELIQSEAESFGVYGKSHASAILASQALQEGDITAAADYITRGLEADPTQITAPSVIAELGGRDRALADRLILRYIGELRNFPLSSKNQSDIRVFYALSTLVNRPPTPGPAAKPGPEVMRAYVSYMLDAFASLEQSEPGYLQRRRRVLLSLWVPLQQYALEMSNTFLALEARSRMPGDNTPLPTSTSIEAEQRNRYEKTIENALDGYQPDEAVVRVAIGKGDFDKARRMIDKLPDGVRKRQLRDAANEEEALSLAAKGDSNKAEALAGDLTGATSMLRVYPALIRKCASGKDQFCADRLMRRAIQAIKKSDTAPPPPPEGIPQSAAAGDPRLDPVLSFIAKLTVEVLPYNTDLALESLDELVLEANAGSARAGQTGTGFDVSVFKRLAPKDAARVQRDAFSLNDPVQRVLALAAVYQWKAGELVKGSKLAN